MNASPATRLPNYEDVPIVPEAIGTFVSLYSGAGGLDIGFALAGFAPIWASELDPVALETHDRALANLVNSRPHLRHQRYNSYPGDILNLHNDRLPQPGSADLVVGGPPCQGFSIAGKMDPHDKRSRHVHHFLDLVDQIKPKAFVLENVKALYSNQRWSGVRNQLVARAQSMGYQTLLTFVNAAHFGVPQSRERMLLIGTRVGLNPPNSPIPITANAPPTVKDALRPLPPFGHPGNDSKCLAKITTAKTPVLRRSPYAGMLFNGAGRPLNLDAPSATLAASMGGNKTPIIDQRVLEGLDTQSWVVEYHARLWKEGLTAVTDKVPNHLRRLTVEEAAAIQTFPAGMEWCGPQSSRFKQIGNAVPPRLALAIAEAVKGSLGA